jgi:Spy/CpxP family protein refolding chaperone
MKKATTMGMAAVLAVASSMVMAAQGGATSPYGVQPGEVRNLNKAPSADDIAKICENKAEYRNLSGAERDSFLSSCKQDV